MSCNKKEKISFPDSKSAASRAEEINAENAQNGSPVRLRKYKCPKCKQWHLSKMSKAKYGRTKDVRSRNEYREKKFVERESEHWNRKFGIEE